MPEQSWIAAIIATLPMLATVPEVAGALHCSRRTVYRLLDAGRLVAVRSAAPGRGVQIRIPRESVGTHLASCVAERAA